MAPPVQFLSNSAGIHIRTKNAFAAVEYHVPGDHPEEAIAVPYLCLADCEGRQSEPVSLELADNDQVAASWSDAGVPQVVNYDIPTVPDGFPGVPDTLSENPPDLLGALRDAMDIAEPQASRYATNTVKLRGNTGVIAATDGHQLLSQHGFQFDWDDDVLIPKTTVFGSNELRRDQPVEIGRSDGWISVRVGPWTFHLAIEKEARFPVVDDHIGTTEAALASFHISDSDASFLSKSLKRLPIEDDLYLPVTVDLNGRVAIRARPSDASQITELLLTQSTRSGEPVRINTNRKYLGRAMKLGFRSVHVFDSKTPVLCQDDRRSYVWALLDPESAIVSSKDAIRIESQTETMPAKTTNTKPRRTNTQMSQTGSQRDKSTKSNGTAQVQNEGVDALIENATALKASLRESLTKTSVLIAELKRHRKQAKLVSSTLASLRQLQAVGR